MRHCNLVQAVGTTCALLLGALAVSCNDVGPDPVDDDGCYPVDPWLDVQVELHQRGFCQWDPGDSPPIPADAPSDYRYYAFTHCFDIEDIADCNGCPPQDVDELLRQEFAKECDQPIDEVVRGCRAAFPDSNKCCYAAYMGSTCEIATH